jgi:hypothetical protein
VIVFETKAEKGNRSSSSSPNTRLAAIASKVPSVKLEPSIPDAEIRARFVAAAARYLARFGGDQKGAGPGSGSGSGSTAG